MVKNSLAVDLENIDVVFKQKDRTVTAVKDVTLKIKKGDIYGIVGYSGAGKSTLVRVINLLQKPTHGKVTVNDLDMLALHGKQLRVARQKIGMIFQHFNLMNARTVAGNVAYPLKGSGLSKKEINNKVNELLDLVGLSDRKEAYPSQLSGGQKQRVAIARALANDPEVIISDEATSALDPKTTKSILTLLQSLNQKLGLTIVLITHEMQAVKDICNNVAVMENGQIVERDNLVKVFSQPRQKITRDFVATASKIDQEIDNVLAQPKIKKLQKNELLIKLKYIGEHTDEPIIVGLYKQFHVIANILAGNVENLKDTPVGNLIIILSGEPENVKTSLDHLNSLDVKVDILKVGEDVREKINGGEA